MSEYCVPAGSGESELVEKRSRFLGHVRPVQSEEEAKAFIAAMKKQYHDARHNCWCYALREGVERYSDDGEPQGSAGLPMLELFRREGVRDYVCVVTRYFGGVLLGTGGLLRAYTESARAALDAAGRAQLRRLKTLEIPCSYAAAQRLQQELAAFDGLVEAVDYGETVCIRALVPAERCEALQARIFDLSGGAVQARVTGETLRPMPTS